MLIREELIFSKLRNKYENIKLVQNELQNDLQTLANKKIFEKILNI